ncbi:MAG TPA: sigma-70 family RNA polymerase sigma factor [Clostridia bacterium]|nr:sigma-70 family RNA polymerase sigma factor [Clostridia bacterium]
MKITEDNFLQQLKAGNQGALEYVIETYSKNVYGLVYRILNPVANKEDMEECVSDVFAAVWKKIDQYNPQRGEFKTWLLILAKYKALDLRRKIQQRAGENFDQGEEIVTSADLVEREVVGREEVKEVIKALDRLKDLDRQIFYQRYFFYWDLDSIAKQFGLSKKAVESRLWRCKNILKEVLAQKGKEGLG